MKGFRPWFVVTTLSLTWLAVTLYKTFYTHRPEIMWSLATLGSSLAMLGAGWYLHKWREGKPKK